MPAPSAAKIVTPAAGSELISATNTPIRMAQMDNPLLAIGPARPGPALRRGFLVAIPVGVALFLEFGLDSPTKGAIATGALLAGFVALDAPARVRAAWQATVAPLVGIAAALGVLTGARRRWRSRRSPWSGPPPATASRFRRGSRSPGSRSRSRW